MNKTKRCNGRLRRLAEEHRRAIREDREFIKSTLSSIERAEIARKRIHSWLDRYTRPATPDDWVEFLKRTRYRVTHHYDYDFPTRDFFVITKEPEEPLTAGYGAYSVNIIVPEGFGKVPLTKEGTGHNHIYYMKNGECVGWGKWIPCYNDTV